MSDYGKQNHIERARILLKQKRYRDAEQQAAAVLKNNPNDADALQIIGHCRLDNGQFPEAIQLFKQCLGLQPGDDYVHYLLAFAYYRSKNKGSALVNLQSAISLNPWASGYYGLYAYIMLDEHKYAEALENANTGLAVNAQDLTCLNARSQALFRLKDKDAAYDTIKEALTVDPEDDFTHTNFGWHFMETGKHKTARDHFRQALRINPNNKMARQGYKESLKANLAPYRWMLMFSLWLSNKSKKARWAIILVIWLGGQLLSRTPGDSAYTPVLYVLLGLYLLFIVFSWVGTSIANAMLLFTREGKYVLTKPEKYVAASVCLCLLGALALAIFSAHIKVLKPDEQFYPALVLLTLTVPVSRFEHWELLAKQRWAVAFTIALVVLGISATALLVVIGSNNISGLLALVYLFGIALYTWGGAIFRK